MSPVHLRRLLARSALLGCVLMATIVASSAFLRLSAAGLGCTDWPTCYGQLRSPRNRAPGLHAPDPTLGIRLARTAHRISAMLAGVLVLFTLAVSAQRSARSFHNVDASTALLLLTLFLAVLGRFTAGTLSPFVPLANLAGGYAMLVLFWSLFVANQPSRTKFRPAPRWLQALTLLVLLLAVTQVLLGALVSAKFGALSCSDISTCWVELNGPGASSAAIDPFAPLILGAGGRVIPGPDAAGTHALHRAGALALIATALALSIALARVSRRPLCGALVALIIALQSIAGWSLAALQFPLQVALVHNALGAALLMCIVSALHSDLLPTQARPGAA